MMKHLAVLILTLSAATMYQGAPAQTAQRRGPIIRQVDHILVESNEPEPLFNFFSDILQLPVAWPLTDNQGFVSGGLGAGNVNLEVFQYAERKNSPAPKVPEARYAGLAFEPYPLSNALSELQIRGIPFSPPEPYISTLPDGSQGILWTTVPLPSFSRPGISIFLYEYSPVFLNVGIRRKQLGNRLALNNGGPLELRSVSEIVIAATNLQKKKAEWRQLLGKQTPSGNWRAGSGPAIRLIQNSKDRICEIIFRVKSLDRAKAFLKRNELLGSVSSEGASLNPSKVQGLKIRLVD
jgi:hypothetical protein